MGGFEVKTITIQTSCLYNGSYPAYLDTSHQEILKNWPQMSDEEIKSYLINCIR